MIRTLWSHIPRSSRTLGAICLLLGLGMLIACLWPFHAPRNTVAWLSSGQGIAFGRYGLLLSSGRFTMPGPSETASCTIELLLRPNPARNGGTVLAFYTPADPVQLFLYQWRTTNLVLRTRSSGGAPPPGHAITVDVLKQDRPVLVTITSGKQGTRVYADGVLRRFAPDFPITNRMLSGEFTAGTGVTGDPWTGRMRGLAIYGRELSPAQVLDNYAKWSVNRGRELSGVEDALALYLFEEGQGDVIHNAITGRCDLWVPERYMAVLKRFLSPPTLNNWDDILLNIAGFVPLGFFLLAYLAAAQRTSRSMVLTILACMVLSISVEALQYFLPTRDSDMTDVITNILGGAIGALLFRWGSQRFEPRARA